MAWIINHNYGFLWDVTHSCPNFNGGSAVLKVADGMYE